MLEVRIARPGRAPHAAADVADDAARVRRAAGRRAATGIAPPAAAPRRASRTP